MHFLLHNRWRFSSDWGFYLFKLLNSGVLRCESTQALRVKCITGFHGIFMVTRRRSSAREVWNKISSRPHSGCHSPHSSLEKAPSFILDLSGFQFISDFPVIFSQLVMLLTSFVSAAGDTRHLRTPNMLLWKASKWLPCQESMMWRTHCSSNWELLLEQLPAEVLQ